MTRRHLFVALSALLFVAPALRAEAPPAATPESVGLSSERLARLHAGMQQYVDAGKVAGVVTYVARNGRVVELQAFGKADVDAGRPMKTDTIFRDRLPDEGLHERLGDDARRGGEDRPRRPRLEVHPRLREDDRGRAAAGRRRGGLARERRAREAADHHPRPADPHRRDLLRQRARRRTQWKAAGIQGWYFADRNEPVSAVVERMAALPMDAQPGEKYVYGYNTDILGVVVEKVSGLTLAEFIQKRITGPLGLADTQFYLPPAQKDRLATVYAAKDGKIERATDPKTGQGHYVEGPRVAFAGGAGLLSTARDYGRFLQMLLNGGEIDGVRLLSPKTVELMTVNHVGTLFAERGPNDAGRGFGLGFDVIEDLGKTGQHGSVGAFGWGGAYHTTYWADPKEKMVVLLMTQLLPAGNSDLHARFRALVYQSIVGPPTGVPAARR